MRTHIRLLAPLGTLAAGAMLLAAVNIGGDTPDITASGAQVQAFYSENRTAQLVGGFLLVYSMLLSIFLASGLRTRFGRDAFATAGFGGFLLFATSAAIGSGLTWVLSDEASKLAADTAQALNVLQSAFFFLLLLGLGAFMLGNGIAILRSRALPSWLGWVALPIGVVAITPIGWIAAVAAIAWALLVAITVAMRPVEAPSAVAADAR